MFRSGRSLIAVCPFSASWIVLEGRIAGSGVPQTKHIPKQLACVAARTDRHRGVYTSAPRGIEPRIIGLIDTRYIIIIIIINFIDKKGQGGPSVCV